MLFANFLYLCLIKQRQPAESKNGSVVVTLVENQLGEHILVDNKMNWTELAMSMYPRGTSVRYARFFLLNHGIKIK